MPYYLNPINAGLNAVRAFPDGYSININWFRAYPSNPDGYIAYNIYYSTTKENLYLENPKYISIDDQLEANIINLEPGQLYFFSVRPVEYDSSLATVVNNFPRAYDNLRYYPTSILTQTLSTTDTEVYTLDAGEFTNAGFIRIDNEILQYASIDYTNNIINIIGGSVSPDGYNILQHRIDGYNYPGKLTSQSLQRLNDGYNVGDGYLVNLSFSGVENWKIRCVFVERDIDGYPKAGTAKFEAIGSKSGAVLDAYAYHPFMEFYTDGYTELTNYMNEYPYYSHIGNFVIWKVNDQNISNKISFEIYENSLLPFIEGDNFDIIINKGSETENGRGYYSSIVEHLTGANIIQYLPFEDNSYDRIYQCQCRFDYFEYSCTNEDGYHQVVKDILTTDLTASDDYNVDFPSYDYAGYHRTDPVQLLTGVCVGSYIGGEQYCIDKNGVVHTTRGFNLQDHVNQREEMLLSVTGRPAVLIQLQHTGITCSCFQPSSEYPDDRCPKCNGKGKVVSYQQYFNPRRSDGRILVRANTADENLKMTEGGLESEFPLDLWTLTVPTIKTRDILVMFDMDNNEEFRYEVLGVTRNNTIVGLQGSQKLKVQRIRKTDPAYQIRVFRDTSKYPSKLNTSAASLIRGTTTILPSHTHEIVINENITNISQINQTTGVAAGHNHSVVNGVIQEVLSHIHTIILP